MDGNVGWREGGFHFVEGSMEGLMICGICHQGWDICWGRFRVFLVFLFKMGEVF